MAAGWRSPPRAGRVVARAHAATYRALRASKHRCSHRRIRGYTCVDGTASVGPKCACERDSVVSFNGGMRTPPSLVLCLPGRQECAGDPAALCQQDVVGADPMRGVHDIHTHPAVSQALECDTAVCWQSQETVSRQGKHRLGLEQRACMSCGLTLRVTEPVPRTSSSGRSLNSSSGASLCTPREGTGQALQGREHTQRQRTRPVSRPPSSPPAR